MDDTNARSHKEKITYDFCSNQRSSDSQRGTQQAKGSTRKNSMKLIESLYQEIIESDWTKYFKVIDQAE